MSILTPTEISECLTGGPTAVARAIETAVIAKLAAGVSVEPVCITRHWTKTSQFTGEPEGHAELVDWTDAADSLIDGEHLLFSADQLQTAIAAARVQAINDALNCYSPDDTATDWADKIRALVGKEST